MAEPDRNSPSTPSPSINRESSDAVAVSSSSNSNSSSAREDDQINYHDHVHVHRVHHDHLFQRSELEHQSGGFSYGGNLTGFDDASNVIRNDTFSCIVVVLTFWFFVSMTLILGVYGPASIRLGPNSSILIQPNPLFVQEVKVNKTKPGLMLYGFYKSPALHTVTMWSDNIVSLFWLILTSWQTAGTEGLVQWLENPTYPNATLSWNIIRGSGVIHQDILTPSSYYFALGGVTVLVYVAFNFLNKFQCIHEDGTGILYGGTASTRAPLLSYKDDDLSSWGSSYESISNDEDCLEEFWAASSLEGKSLQDGEDGNTQHLCAICFDAPRNCFFLPCGHCVACFECGTRIAEAAGSCPVCQRNMKKVRMIFAV